MTFARRIAKVIELFASTPSGVHFYRVKSLCYSVEGRILVWRNLYLPHGGARMEENKLAVLVPGIGYHRDKPLLYYADEAFKE